MAFETKVCIPLREAPNWLSHIEIYREGDEVILDVVKTNGLSYGHGQLIDVEFNNAVDLILTRSSMEKTI